ncbi:helix-turn-helix domain-containing protein [Qingshengfaniella alkalisoli]|uniref:Helix-turn-helix domain-containing protein n=1 Tax=Qingshengfaniella alkalisoli TaxID=2599296 RepID=A0A5B8I5C8_9RHOB|nr:XRE family transcriptional regulator [Qingshengfaniella alkalisoli]QDY68519.1 helix-turn-helix domain-containing protein [Qingshengfaniella alkalisoli]
MTATLIGTRIRERRLALGLRQIELARVAEISAPYLNLIEHNRRKIGGKLLVRLAKALDTDVSLLSEGAEARLVDELNSAATADRMAQAETARIDEFIGRFPGWAHTLAERQRHITALEHRVAALSDRLGHDPVLSDALHEVLSKVSAIRSTATILAETDDLDRNWQDRFHRNLDTDSAELARTSAKLALYLDARENPQRNRLTPQDELDAYLDATGHFLAGLEQGGTLDETPEYADAAQMERGVRDLLISHLEQYARDVERLPETSFVALLEGSQLDPVVLARRAGVDLGTMLRRAAVLLPRSGGKETGLIGCDASGAFILRKSHDSFVPPRFGAGCALWPLYDALAQPSVPVQTLLRLNDGEETFMAHAVATVDYPRGLAAGRNVRSYMLVLRDEDRKAPRRLVGTTCRMCRVNDCLARREPSILTVSFDRERANENTPANND